jgi:hypothetical protein
MAKKTEKKQELESTMVKVCGTITELMYGRRSYANGRKDKEDKYRLSLRLAEGQIEKFIEACQPYYEDAEETYTPKFLKDDATEDDLKYLNLKSGFDFGFVQKTAYGFEEIGGVNEVLDEYGNISGSKVVVTIKIKEGAFYPVAVCIVELHKKSLSDLFDASDFEELPF